MERLTGTTALNEIGTAIACSMGHWFRALDMQMGLGAVARVAAVTHELTSRDALADLHDGCAASEVTQRHHAAVVWITTWFPASATQPRAALRACVSAYPIRR